MEVADKIFENALKSARLAEAAHLDALLALKDAKALRLDLAREKILKGLPQDATGRGLIELKLFPGESPRLFLDLLTSVEMADDGKTYVLQQDMESGRSVLMETSDADALTAHVLKLFAHKRIIAERNLTQFSGQRRDSVGQSDDWITMAYVWLTGFIVGASGLAAWAIYMGKLVF